MSEGTQNQFQKLDNTNCVFGRISGGPKSNSNNYKYLGTFDSYEDCSKSSNIPAEAKAITYHKYIQNWDFSNQCYSINDNNTKQPNQNYATCGVRINNTVKEYIQEGEMWDVNWNVGVGSIIFYIGDTNKQALNLNIRESLTIMNSYDERWGEENKSITQFHSASRPLKFKISFNNKAGFNIIYQGNLVGLFPNIFNISNSSNFKIITTSSQIKVIPKSQLKSESSFEFIKNEINNQKSIINETSDQIEKKAEALEEKQKQVYGQTKEIEDKMRLLETRDKMRELSIDRNLYKNKVIYSLFSVVLAFVIIMIGLYALFNKKLNLGE